MVESELEGTHAPYETACRLPFLRRCSVPGVGGTDGDGLLAALGLRRGEAAEVLHQHLMARRAQRAASGGGGGSDAAPGSGDGSGSPSRLSRPATSAELLNVLREYATRKAAFGELVRQGKLPPRPAD
jgi:hypothetical protein